MVHRLLDQQLQAWGVRVQSDQCILEKRCAEVEGTLEALKKETSWLEGVFTQVTSAELHLLASSPMVWEDQSINDVGVQ